MSTRGLLLLLTTCLLTVAGNLMIRTGLLRAGGLSFGPNLLAQLFALLRQPLFVVGFIFYATAMLTWFSVISTEELSTAYPILTGLTFTLVTVGAFTLFQEHISPQKLIGIGIILAGVVVVARAQS